MGFLLDEFNKGARIAALPLLVLGWLLLGTRSSLQAQSGNQAGLVIVHGDGRVVTRCVTFAEPEISGYTLLQRSGLGLDVSQGAAGAAICRIDGEGCPASDCFCQCQGAPCAYWNYFYRAQDGPWTYAARGATGRTVRPGDVDGWVWGDGASSPPALSLAEICVPEAPVSQPTATSASSEVIVSPTPTPAMTAEPPTPTTAPTSTATRTPPVTTSMPTATATAAASSTAMPTVPLDTATPSSTPTPLPTPTGVAESGSPGYAYAVYVILIVGLGAAFWFVRRRGH